MVKSDAAPDDKNPVGHSGWLIPLGIFLVTFLLSGVVLLFYLAPQPRPFGAEQVLPTPAMESVVITVRGMELNIPSNYLQFESARTGGTRTDVALFALLPELEGYSEDSAEAFNNDAPDSEVIYMLVREDLNNLMPADRLGRIYMPYMTNPAGELGPFSLRQYAFKENSGYRNEDLFVGQTAKGPLMLLCGRYSQQAPSPSCLAIDRPIAEKVSLSYRFKRAHLSSWADIDDSVDRLVARFLSK